jgi:predicted acyltransferase
MQKQRSKSLDALRGLAIFTMILSGSIAFGDTLPAWMYHAQVPPPNHQFNGSIAGITWVDLVFPFFLFAQGAAIPFALQKYISEKTNWKAILLVAGKRYALLLFFALFVQHLKAWVIAENPTTLHQLLSLLAFVLLTLMLANFTLINKWLAITLKSITAIAAVLLLYYLPFWKGKGFDFYKGDIIIIVLANMALFATIWYAATANNLVKRMAILPIIMAVFLSATEAENSWVKVVFNWNSIGAVKLDWAYQFYFLKYLFIVITGTCIGDILRKAFNTDLVNTVKATPKYVVAFLCVALVVSNTVLLFVRLQFLNLLLSFAAVLILQQLAKKSFTTNFYQQLIQIAAYLLLLGLCFEAYQGGIKKDSSTYSYYFVTTALAIFTLLAFAAVETNRFAKGFVIFFAKLGQNPMLAYVAGSLLLLPLMELLNLKQYWDMLNFNALAGFLKGLLFTLAVSGITLLSVRLKLFWKT